MKEFTENELLLLAYLEGDLEPNEKEGFELLLEDDAQLMAEYKLLQKTKLQPPVVSYSGKEQLKRAVVAPIKKEKIILSYLLWPSAIAAGLAILLLWYAPQKQGGSLVANVEVQPKIEVKQTPNPALANSIDAKIEEKGEVEIITKKIITIPPAITIEKEKENIQKQLIINPDMLDAIAYTGPAMQNGETEIIPLSLKPIKTIILVEDNKESWLVGIKNKSVNFVSNFQMPKFRIRKPKGETQYWALTVETDKYEMQAKIFSNK